MYMRYYVKYQYQAGSLWNGGVETVDTATTLSPTDVLNIARHKLDMPEDGLLDCLEIRAFAPIDEELEQDDILLLSKPMFYVYCVRDKNNYSHIDTMLVNKKYHEEDVLKLIESEFKFKYIDATIDKIEILSEIELDPDQKYVY